MSKSGTAQLVLDLGNSSSRVGVIFGRGSKGIRQRRSVLANTFAELPESARLTEQYLEDGDTTILLHDGRRWVNGDYVAREVQSPLRPSATQEKRKSATLALSLRLALLEGYYSIQRLTNASDIDSIDVDWEVTILLPPAEVLQGKEEVQNLIQGLKSIEFEHPNISKTFEITKVNVFSEGHAAFVGTVFQPGGLFREDKKYLLKGITLVADVGAGTTDYCIVRDARVIEDTKFTVPIGGNNVQSRLGFLLRQSGIRVSGELIKDAAETGFVRQGTTEIDISEKLNVAKQEIARSLGNELIEFFEGNNFPAQTIENVLVCGGGAIPSTNDSVRSLGDSLLDVFNKVSGQTKLVTMPVETVVKTDTSGESSEEVSVSQRDLNILGAMVLAGKAAAK